MIKLHNLMPSLKPVFEEPKPKTLSQIKALLNVSDSDRTDVQEYTDTALDITQATDAEKQVAKNGIWFSDTDKQVFDAWFEQIQNLIKQWKEDRNETTKTTLIEVLEIELGENKNNDTYLELGLEAALIKLAVAFTSAFGYESLELMAFQEQDPQNLGSDTRITDTPTDRYQRDSTTIQTKLTSAPNPNGPSALELAEKSVDNLQQVLDTLID